MSKKANQDIPLTQKLLLTAPEVGVLTGLHPDDVYRMGQDGTLPTLKIKRRTRFPTAGVIKWIDDNTRGAA